MNRLVTTSTAALLSLGFTLIASAEIDLHGQWEGDGSCEVFQETALDFPNQQYKKYYEYKVRRNIALSFNTRTPLGTRYWVFGASGHFSGKAGESGFKPGTGKGALTDCDLKEQSYIELNLGSAGLFDFDVTNEGKEWIDLTLIGQGSSDETFTYRCDYRLSKVDTEPVWLVSDCDSYPEPNPNSPVWQ